MVILTVYLGEWCFSWMLYQKSSSQNHHLQFCQCVHVAFGMNHPTCLCFFFSGSSPQIIEERLQLELQRVQLLMIEAQSQALQSQMPLVNEPISFVPPPQATGSADKASRAKGASTAGVWVGLGGSKSQSQGPRTFRSNQKSSKRV